MKIKQCKHYKLPLSKLEIINLYKSGKSSYEIATLCNCSPQSIFYHLKQNKISIRSLSVAMTKYTYNKDYFKIIDTEDKAYFLGLLYADGNVHNNKMTINLQEKDKHILETFKLYINYTGPLTNNIKKENRQPQWRLGITSSELVNDLLIHGIIPVKSFKLTFPTTIPKELQHHFIRGYFDGDGCIYVPNNKANCSFSLVSTFELLESIKLILVNELQFNNNNLYNPPKVKGKNVFTLSYYGRKSLIRLRNWLYKDATIYLNRKHDKFFLL